MKTAFASGLAIVIGLLMAARVAAEEMPQLTVPSSIQQTAFGYYSAPEEKTETSPAEAAAPGSAMACDSSCQPACCDNGCGGCCKERPCRWCCDGTLADPWTLPQPRILADRNITVGGWLDGGIYANQWGDPNNGPIGMRTIGDGFNADQLWIFAERATDTQGDGWDIGGRVDYLFGTDGPDTQAFGDRTWDYGWNSSPNYGSAIPQAYAEIAYNNLKVKLGRFFTPIGYEVVQATGNFFYSHCYSHTYGEPFTHTGGLAEYAYNDRVKLYGGWVNGWDEGWEGANKGSQFLGGVSLTLTEKASLAWMLTAGKIGDGTAFAGAANGQVYMNSIVFNWALSDKWTYIFQHDLGTNYGNGGNDNQWYSINQYLLYKLTDCLSFGSRIEWFQDPQGARVIAGNDGNYYELTGGFNWKPHANLTIRPEIRYDWYNGTVGPNGRPFNSGASDTQLSGGMDVIFTY